MNKSITSSLLVFGFILSHPIAFSQAGSLDLSFDADGIVIADIDDDYTNAMTIQSDGKIVITGYSYNGSDYDFSLARFNSDGSPDNSFSTDGELMADFGGFDQFASSVAVQTDGKIVAAGTTFNGLNNDIMIMRFNADGSFDNSFDGDGIKIIDIGISVDYGRDIAIQSDGKLIVVGSTNDNPTLDFVVLRLNADGTSDNAFDSDGMVLTDMNGFDDYARSVVVQSDGKLVVGGYGYTGIDSDFMVARYNTDGSLDNSFNFDGRVFSDIIGAMDDIGNSVGVHSDGTIVISGYANNGIDNDFAVVRYTASGMPDATFDSDGIVVTNIAGFDDQSFSCAVMTSGKIVVSGQTSEGSSYGFGLVVYDTDGSLETNYDTDGKIITYVMNDTYAQGVALQSDGKIVAAGYGYGFAGSDFVLARYNGEGCSINTAVLIAGNTITAGASGLTYQWLDCDNAFAPIAGETNQDFTATVDGNYAVVITDGSCSDTSSCVNIIICSALDLSVALGPDQLTANLAGATYQWLDCDNAFDPIPGETNQVLFPPSPGNYAVIITDNGCTDTSACIWFDFGGINENLSDQISVYPNPTTGDMMITFEKSISQATIQITDISGRIVFQQTNFTGTNLSIDLTDQPVGIYVLEVMNENSYERLKIVNE